VEFLVFERFEVTSQELGDHLWAIDRRRDLGCGFVHAAPEFERRDHQAALRRADATLAGKRYLAGARQSGQASVPDEQSARNMKCVLAGAARANEHRK
jgi:hypothetical protein